MFSICNQLGLQIFEFSQRHVGEYYNYSIKGYILYEVPD